MPARCRRSKRQKRRNHHWIHANRGDGRNENSNTSSNAETTLSEGLPREDECFLTLPQITTPLQTPGIRKRSCSILRKGTVSSSIMRKRSNSVTITTPTKLSNVNTNSLNSSSTMVLSTVFTDDQIPVHLNNMTPKRPCISSPYNESYIDNLSTSNSSTVLLKNRRAEFLTPAKNRSNSSMSKLDAPGADKIPITVDVSTQTIDDQKKTEDKGTLCLESCINIFETPKISQADLLDCERTPLTRNSFLDVDKIDFKLGNLSSKLQRLKFQKLQNFSDVLYSENSPKIYQNDIRQNVSDTDFSFHPLLDPKSVSTPINKINNNDKLLENLAKSVIGQNFLQKHNDQCGSFTYNTPKTSYNHNLKKSSKEKIFTQKIKKFDNSSWIKKRRSYKSFSPKKTNEVHIKNLSMKAPNKKNETSFVIPKSFTPAKSTVHNRSENFLNIAVEAGRYDKIKKFHTKYVSKWIARIWEICSWLGLTIKRNLLPKSFFKQKFHETCIETIDECKPTTANACTNCHEYKMKVIVLMSKVEVLERELNISTMENRETITTLVEEITKIKQDLSEIDDIKKKLKDMEEMIKSRPSSCAPPPPPPPPPCLPPPPPPPLPPMLTLNMASPIARPKTGAGKKHDKKSNENSRPVISLDDILKVKLKKTSEKPLSARRVQQPIISVEMLNQIKLRPTSRPQTPCSLKDVSSNNSLCATSPASGLSKILSNVDTNVRRVKRLRRLNGYSLDDSRRHALRREYSGIDDT